MSLTLYVDSGYWDNGYAVGEGGNVLIGSEIQSVAPSAIIELFELQLSSTIHGSNTTYRFHAGTNAVGNGGNVVWAGNAYQAMPIEAEGFEYSGNGQLPRPKIRVSNIMGTITSLILATPLEGAKVTRIRTLARYLDHINWPGGVSPYFPDPTADLPAEIYYLDRKSVENRDVVEYEMCSAFDLVGVRSPKRQCIANICQWQYRSAECGYNKASYFDVNNNPVGSAALDVCGKRLDSCQKRFSVYTLTGTVTAGSNIWTTASTANIPVGEIIRGWGLPTGTTVSAISSGTTLTLSANATASNSAGPLTGTVTAGTETLTMTSATGIVAGMAITGTYMTNTTVASVSGFVVTLSRKPYLYLRTATSNVVTNRGVVISRGITVDTTGLAIGWRVWGSTGIDTTIASIPTAGVAGSITLTNYGNLPGDVTPLELYFIPPSPTASSYTFTADTTYAFRDVAGELPFGSMPGVGGYS
jgi:lambda family phage minor tail protein L